MHLNEEACGAAAGDWFDQVITCDEVMCEPISINSDGTGDYPTISDAVAEIDNLGIIELSDGLYTGEQNREFVITDKTVVIRSTSGDPSACIINAEFETGCIQVVNPIERQVFLEGLTLTDFGVRHPIYFDEGRGKVSNCLFFNSASTPIRCSSDQKIVIDACRFYICDGHPSGIKCGANTSVSNCTFLGCGNPYNSSGTIQAYSAATTISNCSIVGCGDDMHLSLHRTSGLPDRLAIECINPYRLGSVIRLAIPPLESELSTSSIALFDLNGRVVRQFQLSDLSPGIQELVWDGLSDTYELLPSGIYFLHVQLSQHEVTKRIILTR